MNREESQLLNTHLSMEDGAAEISKKDALRETGISYGQFYRWKRMGLIPEAWFHRRSTFTGQETFLPRRKLLERIRRIQELKDRYSLEQIAVMLSPDVVTRSYSPAELQAMTWISSRAQVLLPRGDDHCALRFLDLVCLTMTEHLLAAGKLTDQQIRLVAQTLLARFADLDNTGSERYLSVAMREGETFVALHTGTLVFDDRVRVVTSVTLNSLIEEVKVRLRDLME